MADLFDHANWPPLLLGAAAIVAVAGLGSTLIFIKQGVTDVEGQHWVMLAVILVAGYVLGRIWTTPAQMIGLP